MESILNNQMTLLADADLELARIAKSVQECQLQLQGLQREQQLALEQKMRAQAVIEALRPAMEPD